MRVGFHSPLPPAHSGVADHAADLLAVLRRHGKVEIAPRHADVHLYHLGNNQLHAEIYRAALIRPGVIVLHDAVLHHFALGFFDREQYISEFVYNYGEWARDLASELWEGASHSVSDARYFSYGMLRRVAEQSLAVIVHNPAAAQAVRTHAPAARVFEVPLLYMEKTAPPAVDILAARKWLGVRSGELLCGVFGHLREPKRLGAVLRVFERLQLPILVAGSCPPNLERSIQPYLSMPHVHRIPYGSAAEFHLLTHAVDVCINLRYPGAGETSAIAVTTMGIGKAVIVTDDLENSGWPEGACLRVPHGIGEEAMLEDLLRWLTSVPADARAVGVRARTHVLHRHSPERVAELYWNVLRSTLD